MHLGELSFYNKVTLMRGLISLALNFYDSRLKQTGHFLALMGSYYTTSVSAYRANFEPQPANFQSRASQVSMGHKTNSPIVLFCLIQSQFIKPSCFKILFFKICQLPWRKGVYRCVCRAVLRKISSRSSLNAKTWLECEQQTLAFVYQWFQSLQ